MADETLDTCLRLSTTKINADIDLNNQNQETIICFVILLVCCVPFF